MDSELSNDTWPCQSTDTVVAGRPVSIRVQRLGRGTLLDVIPGRTPIAKIINDLVGAFVLAALVAGSGMLAFLFAKAILDPRQSNPIVIAAITLTPAILVFVGWLVFDTRKWRSGMNEQAMRFQSADPLERIGMLLFESQRSMSNYLDSERLQQLASSGTVNGAMRAAAAPGRLKEVAALGVEIEPTPIDESDPGFRELYSSQRIDPDSDRFNRSPLVPGAMRRLAMHAGGWSLLVAPLVFVVVIAVLVLKSGARLPLMVWFAFVVLQLLGFAVPMIIRPRWLAVPSGVLVRAGLLGRGKPTLTLFRRRASLLCCCLRRRAAGPRTSRIRITSRLHT